MAGGRQIMLRVTDEEFAAIETAAQGNKQAYLRRLIWRDLFPGRSVPRRAGGIVAHLPRCSCKVCKPEKAAAR